MRDFEDGLPAVVKRSIFLGVTTHYFLEMADGKEVEVIQNSDIFDIIPDNTEVRLTAQHRKINGFVADGSRSLIAREVSL